MALIFLSGHLVKENKAAIIYTLFFWVFWVVFFLNKAMCTFGVKGAYFTHLSLPQPWLDKHLAITPKNHTLGGV